MFAWFDGNPAASQTLYHNDIILILLLPSGGV
jgi:hypothetical protein